MSRKAIVLPDIRNVAASSTAILNVPTGPTYHGIILTYKESGTLAVEADLEDAIAAIRVKINGKTQREFSGAILKDLNEFRGKAFNAGQIAIMFSEPWRPTVQMEDALAWGTADVQTFQIEIDLSSGASTPTMSAIGITEDIVQPMGLIKKIRKVTIPSGVANGKVNVHDLPRNPGDIYLAAHALHANLTGAQVLLQGDEIWNLTTAQANEYLKQNKLVPQTSYVHIVFDATNRVTDGLAMAYRRSDGQIVPVSDFRVNLDIGTAATFDIYTEVLGLRD